MSSITRLLPYLLISFLSVGLYSCKSNNSGGIAARKQLTDIDGNIYQTVKIGKQLWMAENLRVTTYNDGNPIPLLSNSEEWYRCTTPAYCMYNNDSALYGNIYGALYNYYTINTEKLCPTGWHVPHAKDFQLLISTLDPNANFIKHEVSSLAGGMLKDTNSLYWADPNTGASNKSGFSALPGGCRSYRGNFSMAGTFGYFGSSTEETTLALRFASSSAFMRNKVSKYVGVSVRCVKNP